MPQIISIDEEKGNSFFKGFYFRCLLGPARSCKAIFLITNESESDYNKMSTFILYNIAILLDFDIRGY